MFILEKPYLHKCFCVVVLNIETNCMSGLWTYQLNKCSTLKRKLSQLES